jgi:hypothetical protein
VLILQGGIEMDTQYKNRMVVLMFLVVAPSFFAASYFVSGVFNIPSLYVGMVHGIFSIIPTMVVLVFLQAFGEGKMTKNQRTIFKSMILGFFISATFWLYIQGAFNNLNLGLMIFWFEVYLIIIIVMYLLVKSKPKVIDKWFHDTK